MRAPGSERWETVKSKSLSKFSFPDRVGSVGHRPLSGVGGAEGPWYAVRGALKRLVFFIIPQPLFLEGHALAVLRSFE